MRLLVSFQGQAHEVEVPPDAATKDLQAALVGPTGVLARQQKLVHKGKVLAAGDSLAAAGLVDGSKVMLIATSGEVQTRGAAAATSSKPSTTVLRCPAAAPGMDAVRGAKEKGGQSIGTWEERGRNWAASGVASLSGLALTSVPEQAIANLPTGTRLRALDLSNNALTALPATLPELPSLTRLSLASNRITADGLPSDVLTRLVGLLVLDLSSNALQALPGVLGCLRHLKKLNLRNNAFESLTMEALAGMAKLEVLDISDNRLSSLPEEMGEALPGLQELRLDRNRLMSLPGSFSGLSQLQVLTADGNRLSQLPPGLLSRCTALHLLSLHVNEVTLEQLREMEGWGDYDARRRARYTKVMEGGAMMRGFDEGASSTLYDHWGSADNK